jgi:hypothetical protein
MKSISAIEKILTYLSEEAFPIEACAWRISD